jgi:gluconokinase
MPATLLDSQLGALEPLAVDERGVRVDNSGPVDEVVSAAVTALRDIR